MEKEVLLLLFLFFLFLFFFFFYFLNFFYFFFFLNFFFFFLVFISYPSPPSPVPYRLPNLLAVLRTNTVGEAECRPHRVLLRILVSILVIPHEIDYILHHPCQFLILRRHNGHRARDALIGRKGR